MTKRAAKKKPAKKASAKKSAAKPMTAAQRNAKAYEMLKEIVKKCPREVINDYLCDQGKELVMNAGALTGAKRFLTGTVSVDIRAENISFNDLRASDSDHLDYKLVVTNRRTGEVVEVPVKDMYSINEDIDTEFND